MKFPHFEAEVSVGYQFVKAAAESRDLVVVFPGRREAGRKPWPEYVMELSSYDVNKLFIIDDLMEITIAPFIIIDNDYKLERSINALLTKIIDENHIENVVLAGASGGGSAAVYYGLKNNFNFIASSPSLFYGTALTKTEEYARIKMLLGETNNENTDFLDSFIPDVIKEKINTFTKKGFINFGRNEQLVTECQDAKFVEDILDKNNADIKLTFADFSDHMECVAFLSRNFKTYLDEIFESEEG